MHRRLRPCVSLMPLNPALTVPAMSWMAPTRRRRVLIAVEDECGGLPDGKIDGLFRSFEQRNADRTGLGLAMCRWGTEINGGHISARNRHDRGCVFTLDPPRG